LRSSRRGDGGIRRPVASKARKDPSGEKKTQWAEFKAESIIGKRGKGEKKKKRNVSALIMEEGNYSFPCGRKKTNNQKKKKRLSDIGFRKGGKKKK